MADEMVIVDEVTSIVKTIRYSRVVVDYMMIMRQVNGAWMVRHLYLVVR